MKKLIILLFFICLSKLTDAQQDAQASMYFFNPLSYNPAYAGTRESFNITAVHRSQWLGWAGAPTTQFLSIHAPIARKKIGLGGNVSYDRIGSRTGFSAVFDFAYHLYLNNKGLKLSMGGSAGLFSNQASFSDLKANDVTDVNYQSSYSSMTSNFGAGLYLHSKNGYLGLSSPRLLDRSLDKNNGNSFSQKHYYAAAGYVFKMNSVIDLKPSLLYKYTKNGPFALDVNLSAHFYKRFWIGGMFRFNESVGFNCAYTFNDVCQLGYSFDFPYNGLRLNNWGSHELLICFDLKTKNHAFVSPRYF